MHAVREVLLGSIYLLAIVAVPLLEHTLAGHGEVAGEKSEAPKAPQNIVKH